MGKAFKKAIDIGRCKKSTDFIKFDLGSRNQSNYITIIIIITAFIAT